MNPSDLRIRAISTLSFDEGSSTRSWCDWIPLRIRVNISATGSVIDILESSVLPACFGHAGDVTAERELPKTDPAKLKLAQVATWAPADLAAILRPGHELGLALRLDDHRRFCHLVSSLSPEGHPELAQQKARLLVVLRRSDDGDVHSLGLVDLGHVDLREDDVIADAEGVVAAAVERLGRHAAEVAHARQRDIDQAVEELVHLLAAQGDPRADRLSLAQLEAGDRLLGLGHHRLLSGDGG